jgi:hypothetical protein
MRNKQIMQDGLSWLPKGNDTSLIDAMSDDMQWHWIRTGFRVHIPKTLITARRKRVPVFRHILTTLT